jgi:hypothetical protein
MTVVRKNMIRKVKDITIGSTLFFALAGGITACSSSDDGDADYEVAEVYTKGVKSYIKEVSKDEFKIVEEREVAIDSAGAIVTYLNGKQDTLNPETAKRLVDNDIQNQQQHHYHHRSPLSTVLLHGGMGYMFARMMNNNNNNNNNQYYTARQQYEQQNKSGGSGVYASPAAYQSANTVQANVVRSKTTVSRPMGSRSGFFRGSVRSSHIG